jgi:hypothetical protein
MDSGVERVTDANEARAARSRARGVVLKSLALAAILTGLAYALP